MPDPSTGGTTTTSSTSSARENAITTAQVCVALDQEMVEAFKGEYDRFEEILGIFPAETVAAGTALYQYKVTGELAESPNEGETTPLSLYKVEKVPVGEIGIKRYGKQTTAEAILKGGFEVAVAKTDKKMLQQLRSGVMSDFFTALGNGTGTATGEGLQAALAQSDAALQVALEGNNDEAGAVVHFVNPLDIADYLAKAQVTMQTLFGMNYLKNFLGVDHILVTSKVEQGTLFATPVENIHIRGIDFGTLSDAGLVYERDSLGLIGIHHVPDYDRGSADTYAMVGANFLPEVLDYIVKGTIESE